MARFLKFNIENKIVLGYLPLFLVIILTAIYPLIIYNKISKINKNIVENDIILIETADKMVDSLLIQESYGRRYIILKNQEILSLFWQRSREFDLLIARIRSLPEQKNIPVRKMVSLHSEFNKLYEEGIEHLNNPDTPITMDYDGKIKIKLEELINLIQTTALDVKRNQTKKLLEVWAIGLKAFRISTIFSGIAILLGIALISLIARGMLRSISQMKLAIREISEGRFDRPLYVNTQDELGELATAFGEMTLRLSRLEKMSLDASPLTRLPGGIAIEEFLKKRLHTGYPVAFCLIDLDNFKSFNDRYGYAMGNEIIKATAKIIETAIEKHGTGDDFVGHIGGDDFALITIPEKHEVVCNYIIKEFDKT
ncbi:diguanylate cyclase, partial [Candidatus Babeliales bacterium]|nr:diguanylate cyclase [Candidatus Babeliales bacterium]